jgi:hypothetical protein
MLPDRHQTDCKVSYIPLDRIMNGFLLGKPVPAGPYLLISQFVHSMRFYDSAGWELQAIPESHARLCTHCLVMDSYPRFIP